MIEAAIQKAQTNLLSYQRDGYWQYPLESDCTMPAEYIMLQHFLGIGDNRYEDGICNYILSKQNGDGGWPLYDGGDSDLSCSVKAYFALKLAGIGRIAKHNNQMAAAVNFIRSKGGAAKANVFTRIALAMFEQMPWDTIPWQPIELAILPKWFPFNIHKVSYWSRTVMLPLAVLVTNRAVAKNPTRANVAELFIKNPWNSSECIGDVEGLRPKLIVRLEKFCHKHFANGLRDRYHSEAIQEMANWLLERADNSEGLGGIFPAMAALRMAIPYMPWSGAVRQRVLESTNKGIEKLIVSTYVKDCSVWDKRYDEVYVQPCISPVWDTAIATLALQDSCDVKYGEDVSRAISQSIEWLKSKQIRINGDWIHSANVDMNLPLNGWAFQNYNDHYPDVDDTAMVLLALQRTQTSQHSLNCGRTWLTTMQSKNGGYGAFDANNDTAWINDIPFADHKCMLDPPTADVSGRVLAALFYEKNTKHYSRKKLINYLLKEQNKNGFWWGRWGTNYLWGTWSAVMGLKHAVAKDEKVGKALVKAGVGLLRFQATSGAYGESNAGYEINDVSYWRASDNAFHTSLALLAMCDIYECGAFRAQEFAMAASHAAKWLAKHQQVDGTWLTMGHNAPGFPKVFYLKYHGYATYFPLWALSRYVKVFK